MLFCAFSGVFLCFCVFFSLFWVCLRSRFGVFPMVYGGVRLGLKVRRENAEKRNLLIERGREILNSKMDVTEDDKELAKLIGYKLGKKAPFGEVAFIRMFNAALVQGNYKAFVELGRMIGMHFDQSPEALGGSENPLNVQAVAIAPKQVKDISEALEDNC